MLKLIAPRIRPSVALDQPDAMRCHMPHATIPSNHAIATTQM